MSSAFAIILPIACVILAVRFALEPEVSPRSRYIVGGLAVASFASPWYAARVLVQLADSLFVLLYLKAHSR